MVRAADITAGGLTEGKRSISSSLYWHLQSLDRDGIADDISQLGYEGYVYGGSHPDIDRLFTNNQSKILDTMDKQLERHGLGSVLDMLETLHRMELPWDSLDSWLDDHKPELMRKLLGHLEKGWYDRVEEELRWFDEAGVRWPELKIVKRSNDKEAEREQARWADPDEFAESEGKGSFVHTGDLVDGMREALRRGYNGAWGNSYAHMKPWSPELRRERLEPIKADIIAWIEKWLNEPDASVGRVAVYDLWNLDVEWPELEEAVDRNRGGWIRRWLNVLRQRVDNPEALEDLRDQMNNAARVLRQHGHDWPEIDTILHSIDDFSKRKRLGETRQPAFAWIKSKLPKWPEYVLRDWIYNHMRGNFGPHTIHTRGAPTDKSTHPEEALRRTLAGEGMDADTQWRLVPNFKFVMDELHPDTQRHLKARAGGSLNPYKVPRDAERHATQAKLAKQEGGIRKQPVIGKMTPQGFELIEGWHRTIQHFKQFPDGYVGPAWIAIDAKPVSEDLREDNPFTPIRNRQIIVARMLEAMRDNNPTVLSDGIVALEDMDLTDEEILELLAPHANDIASWMDRNMPRDTWRMLNQVMYLMERGADWPLLAVVLNRHKAEVVRYLLSYLRDLEDEFVLENLERWLSIMHMDMRLNWPELETIARSVDRELRRLEQLDEAFNIDLPKVDREQEMDRTQRRWLSMLQQNINRLHTVVLVIAGNQQTLRDWPAIDAWLQSKRDDVMRWLLEWIKESHSMKDVGEMVGWMRGIGLDWPELGVIERSLNANSPVDEAWKTDREQKLENFLSTLAEPGPGIYRVMRVILKRNQTLADWPELVTIFHNLRDPMIKDILRAVRYNITRGISMDSPLEVIDELNALGVAWPELDKIRRSLTVINDRGGA